MTGCGIQGIILGMVMVFGISCMPKDTYGAEMAGKEWEFTQFAGLPAMQSNVPKTDLEIEVSDGFIDVQIRSEEEYNRLTDWINGYSGKIVRLTLDLAGTDVKIYLDELLDGSR